MYASMRLIEICILLAALSIGGLAQEKLGQVFARNNYPIKIEAATLTGPGADLLSREAEAAQFVLIGEPHGIADVPIFSSALFKHIQPKGFNYLAIEIGPITARRIEDLAVR